MRLRHIKGSEEMIAQSPYVISQPEIYRGKFKDLFDNDYPLEIEVGMGKGKFIMEMARQHPEVNYIGIERYSSVLLKGLERRANIELDHVYFACVDARKLAEIFAPGEISRIYLNFSDPWPKERHAKRRLTSPEFLSIYKQILGSLGTVEFKTDNRALFEYSLETIAQANWKLLGHTFDLHHDPMGEGNIMTEYEEKFSAKGNPICKLIAKPQ